MRGPEAEPRVVPTGKKQVRQKAWQSGMGRGQGGGRTRKQSPGKSGGGRGVWASWILPLGQLRWCPAPVWSWASLV